MLRYKQKKIEEQEEELDSSDEILAKKNQIITDKNQAYAELEQAGERLLTAYYRQEKDLLDKGQQINELDNEKSNLLTNYQQIQAQKVSYENYLQMGLKVNHLNNLPINNSGQSLQQLITYYNNHSPRARLISLKTQTKDVIAQYRDDQSIDNSELNTQLITDYAITQTN